MMQSSWLYPQIHLLASSHDTWSYWSQFREWCPPLPVKSRKLVQQLSNKLISLYPWSNTDLSISCVLTGNIKLQFTSLLLRNRNQSLSFHVKMFLTTHIQLTWEVCKKFKYYTSILHGEIQIRFRFNCTNPEVCGLLSQTLLPHFLFPVFSWDQKMTGVLWPP